MSRESPGRTLLIFVALTWGWTASAPGQEGGSCRWSLATGPEIPALAVADFDVDGRTDLLLLDTFENRARVLRNGGGGIFAEVSSLETRSAALGLLAADLDSDATPDMVVGNGGFRSVTVAFGDGDGRFSDVREVPLGVEVRHQAVGDFNEDGILDVVAGGGNQGLVVLSPGNPDRSFGSAVILFTPVRLPHVIVVGDYDGDDHQDLAVWGRGESPYLAIYEGRGDGRFDERSVPELPDPGERELSAVAADLDGDGRDELLFLLPAEPSLGDLREALHLVERDDSGSYVAARFDLDLTRSENSRLLVADIDLDGWPDAILLDEDSSSRGVVLVLRNLATGANGFAAPHAIPLTSRVTIGRVGDFNEDGLPDLAVALPDENRLELILGPLLAECEEVSCYASSDEPAAFTSPVRMAVRATATGGAEVVVVGEGESRLLTLVAGRLRERSSFPSAAVVKDIAVGDLDGDGEEDIAVTDFAGSQVEIYFPRADGGPGVDTTLLDGGLLPAGIVLADLDSDAENRLDVAIALFGEDRVAVFLGRGSRKFSEAIYLEAGSRPYDIAAGHVNEDGLKDLVVTHPASNRVSLLRGVGGGRFEGPIDIATMDDPRIVVIDDLNGDGRDDLVLASFSPGLVKILLSGAEGFQDIDVGLPLSVRPSAIEVTDLDFSGRKEILVADSASRALMFFTAREGRYVHRESLLLSAAPQIGAGLSLGVGDLDADGFEDLALGDAGRDEVRVYRALDCRQETEFRRGDADGNGELNLSDAIMTLNHLFLGGPAPGCEDASDTDDNGEINLTDAVVVLNHLFRGGPTPGDPFPECGRDPTDDELTCGAHGACE